MQRIVKARRGKCQGVLRELREGNRHSRLECRERAIIWGWDKEMSQETKRKTSKKYSHGNQKERSTVLNAIYLHVVAESRQLKNKLRARNDGQNTVLII